MKITDKISVGATAAFGIMNARSGVENFFVDNAGFIVDPNIVGADPTLLLYTTDIDEQDTDVTFNLGVHWRPLEKLSFGAVYRGGMEFEVPETIANETILAFLFGQTLSGTTGNPLATTFNTPASWGAGVAWRPMSQLTVSADWLHINYTDMLDGFQSGINVLTLFDTNAVFTIDDADEFHVGGEYVFSVGTVPLAVRAGLFSDHNSRIFADFTNGFSFFSTNDTFPPRDTEIHYTIGTGVVVKERFQIDAAADLSDIANEYVLSTIFRF
jgi:long-subunit fatty acid transport protein